MIQEERAKMPPGTRLMDEEERLQTLQDLHDSKREVSAALEKLPISMHTISMKNHKVDLETKLIRIEKAIETFSKNKVYIAY